MMPADPTAAVAPGDTVSAPPAGVRLCLVVRQFDVVEVLPVTLTGAASPGTTTHWSCFALLIVFVSCCLCFLGT